VKINFQRVFKRTCQMESESGMSLVETLVALAILGICGTAFITALSIGSIAVNTHDESVTAQSLAQAQIEAIKSAPFDSTGISYSKIPTPNGYTISINVDSAIYSNSNIQEITVDILRDGNNVLELESYKVNR
jgi:prepilin-type N-terminal cleavage/methylation domain-containing protein